MNEWTNERMNECTNALKTVGFGPALLAFSHLLANAGTDGGPVEMVISLLAAGIFSAYIVYDTNMLLKRYPIDGGCQQSLP